MPVGNQEGRVPIASYIKQNWRLMTSFVWKSYGKCTKCDSENRPRPIGVSINSNGQQAAEAWHSYQQAADSSILRDLQAYNQEDVQMLRFLIRVLVSRHARSIAM